MKLSRPTPRDLAIAVAALESYCIEGPLTSEIVLAALTAYEPELEPGKQQPTPPRLITRKAFADRMGACTRTVDRLLAAGEIRSVLVGKRSVRIAESELMRLIEEGQK